MEYPYIYRKVKFDKMTDKYTQSLGFQTTAQTRPFLLAKLQKYVNERKIQINDLRLQYEINTFIYSSNGRPEASGKRHDDIIFATALALQGLDQVSEEIGTDVALQRPANIREVLELEGKFNTTWDRVKENFGNELIEDWFNNREVNFVDDVYYLDD
jgi:hypothetical protein